MSNYFSHFKHYKAFIIRFWFLVALAFLTSVNAIASVSVEGNKEEQDESLKGVEVKFDYKGYPEERELAYQYLTTRYPDEPDEPRPIKKEQIGIFLYDLDNDKEPEILIYLMHSGYCGSAGCGFGIIKRKKIDGKFEELIKANLVVHEKIRILNDSYLGHNNLLFFNRFEEPGTIWKWNGKCYD